MNYIFYQTKTKFTNTGDVLINRALIDALRLYGAVLMNDCKEVPDAFLDQLGIREDERMHVSDEREFLLAILRYAIKARKNGDRVFLFSGPGDLYGGNMKQIARNVLSSLVFLVYRMIGVRVVRIGRSVGPITRLMAVSEWIRALSISDYYVRDTQSLERCCKIGIRKVRQCPDMSWLFTPEAEMNENQTNVVMVNLRDRIFDEYHEKFAENTIGKCKEVLAVLNTLSDQPLKIVITYQVKEDRAFGRRIYEELRDAYDVEFRDCQMTLDDFEATYGSSAFHISNRMHSLLVGHKYGSVPIALIDRDNHVKISATLQDCNMEHLIFDIHRPLEFSRLCTLYNGKSEVLELIWRCEQNNKKAIYGALSRIIDDENCS